MLDRPKRTGPVTIDELMEVAESAFAKAREENRRLGIPNGFERDGKLLWELPDGTITDVNPFARVEGRPPGIGGEGAPEGV